MSDTFNHEQESFERLENGECDEGSIEDFKEFSKEIIDDSLNEDGDEIE
jgi:hypothetical protein